VDAGPEVLSDNMRRIGEAFEQVDYEIEEVLEAGAALASIAADEQRAQSP
jgi:hypothetical protein